MDRLTALRRLLLSMPLYISFATTVFIEVRNLKASSTLLQQVYAFLSLSLSSPEGPFSLAALMKFWQKQALRIFRESPGILLAECVASKTPLPFLARNT